MIKHLLISILIIVATTSCNSTASSKSSTDQSSTDSISQSQSSPAFADDRQYLVKVGDMAPDFEMTMPDGTKIVLSQLRGKVVMLQFTASWCGVCRKEMPYIETEIWEKHKNNPQFALYGIDRDEPAEKIAELRKATGVTYPIGMDPGANIFGLYAEKEAGITRNIIIDREGKIVMLTRLFEEEEFKRMVDTIDQLLSI